METTTCKKKLAAAMAGVNAYLMMEAEAAYLEQQAAADNARQLGPNMWAISGRQEMMTMRNMIAFRAIRTI
ncbi:MAG: hypothetical protein CSA32_02415 [Desulfobulbus propionicus]|nr:MAG: hypothetical protein CSA32_02415 [Desulfobulbus propionicus]